MKKVVRTIVIVMLCTTIIERAVITYSIGENIFFNDTLVLKINTFFLIVSLIASVFLLTK